MEPIWKNYRNEPILWTLLYGFVVSWSKLQWNVYIAKSQGWSWGYQCGQTCLLRVKLVRWGQNTQKDVGRGSHVCWTQRWPSRISSWFVHNLFHHHDHRLPKLWRPNVFQLSVDPFKLPKCSPQLNSHVIKNPFNNSKFQII